MSQNNNYLAILEGLLFLKGDSGASMREIKEALELNKAEATQVLMRLNEIYTNSTDRGLLIKRYANNFRLVTKTEYYEIYKNVLGIKNYLQLSSASYETLAIISYNGPITKVQIEEIRGVNCDSVINNLKTKGLIQQVGKSELAGKPMLYGVSSFFMQYFNLESLAQLPEFDSNKEKTPNNLYKKQ